MEVGGNDNEDDDDDDDMFHYYNTDLPNPETIRLVDIIEEIINEFNLKLAWLTNISYPASLSPTQSRKMDSSKEGKRSSRYKFMCEIE